MRVCENEGLAYLSFVQSARGGVSEHANVTQHVSCVGRVTRTSRCERLFFQDLGQDSNKQCFIFG